MCDSIRCVACGSHRLKITPTSLFAAPTQTSEKLSSSLTRESERLGEPDTADLTPEDAHRGAPAYEREPAEHRDRDGVEVHGRRDTSRQELPAHPADRRLAAGHEPGVGERARLGVLEGVEYRRDRDPMPGAHFQGVESQPEPAVPTPPAAASRDHNPTLRPDIGRDQDAGILHERPHRLHQYLRPYGVPAAR